MQHLEINSLTQTKGKKGQFLTQVAPFKRDLGICVFQTNDLNLCHCHKGYLRFSSLF
jgi:hypothetical protein